MPSKKSSRKKEKKQVKKKENKFALKSNNIFVLKNNNIFNSSIFLFIITLISIIKIFYLWTNEDNESLFLFILIAFIVYNQDPKKNMIFVLGIPLIVVNVLIYTRGLFNNEGFQDLSGVCSNYGEKEINKCKAVMTSATRQQYKDFAETHVSTLEPSKFKNFLNRFVNNNNLRNLNRSIKRNSRSGNFDIESKPYKFFTDYKNFLIEQETTPISDDTENAVEEPGGGGGGDGGGGEGDSGAGE